MGEPKNLADMAASLQRLLPERYPLPAEAAARFAVYSEAQGKRRVEALELQAKLDALAEDVTTAKNEFFDYLSKAVPELRGKHVQLNPEDGTYQFMGFAAANEERKP